MKTSTHDAIKARAGELYRKCGPEVDTATAARLRAARRHAMEQASAPRHHGGKLRWMVPAGAFAMAALALVVNWQILPRTPADTPHLGAPTAQTDEILPPDADQTDPALYQDMDFYAWLSEQPAVANQTSRQ